MMQKYIWMTLVLLLFYACSKPAPIPEVKDVNKTTTEELGAKTVPSTDMTAVESMVVTEVEEQTETFVENATEEFVPDHIKNSRIEVVEHY